MVWPLDGNWTANPDLSRPVTGVCLVLFLQSQRGATQTMEEGGEAWRGGEGSERGGLREPLSVEGGNYGSFNTNSRASGTLV
jgi:hypothetical protein